MKKLLLGAPLLPLLFLACSGGDSGAKAENDESLWTVDGGADARDSGLGKGDSGGGFVPAASKTALGTGKATLTTLFQDTQARQPTDIDFNPRVPGEAWLVNYADDTVTILHDLGKASATSENRHDAAASHFMHRPPGLSFGTNDAWATCGNGDNGGNHFMGPSLFSADLDIFAVPTPGGLGSHLDMLHLTSFCRGITHETGNVYWAFNSQYGSIERYDFAKDHGPGNDDHSDGKVARYLTGALKGIDGMPSHLAFDSVGKWLYVADTGNGRVVMLNTKSGTPGAQLPLQEAMAQAVEIQNAEGYIFVAAGSIKAPSGVALSGSVLYVGDAASGRITAFSTREADQGAVLGTLETGLTQPGALAGMRIGPDGKLYLVDRQKARVLRVDP